MKAHIMAAFIAAQIERTSATREISYCPPTIGPCHVSSTMAEVLSGTLEVAVIILTLIVVVMWLKRKRHASLLMGYTWK